MKKSTLLLVLLIFFTFTGCGRRSLEDFRAEGETVSRALILELSKIRTREQLIASGSRLQRLFNDLTDLMIAAHEFRQKHKETEKIDLPANLELNNLLRNELNRIYKIEGGRQLIEKFEEQALHRLDSFERRLK